MGEALPRLWYPVEIDGQGWAPVALRLANVTLHTITVCNDCKLGAEILAPMELHSSNVGR